MVRVRGETSRCTDEQELLHPLSSRLACLHTAQGNASSVWRGHGHGATRPCRPGGDQHARIALGGSAGLQAVACTYYVRNDLQKRDALQAAPRTWSLPASPPARSTSSM